MSDPIVAAEILTTLNVVFVVVLTCALLLRRGRRGDPLQIDTRRALLAAAVVVATAVVRLPLMILCGLGVFGLVRVAYAELVIGLPLVGAVVLFLARRRRAATRPVVAMAIAAVLMAPLGAWCTFVEPYRLQVELTNVPLSAARAGVKPIRIGVLADVQTDRVGEFELGAVARLMEQRPDVILVPGDVFQRGRETFADNRERLEALFSLLHAEGGVFVVQGDCERNPRRFAQLRSVCESSGARVLDDEAVRVSVGDRQICLIGVGMTADRDAAHALVRTAATTSAPGDVRILVTHRPDLVLGLRDRQFGPDADVDLVIAGHTHGGQINVPFFGPPVTLSAVPRHVAAGGLHEVDGTRIYVSRGLGCERGQAPRVRFNCPPEVSVITLTGSAEVASVPTSTR